MYIYTHTHKGFRVEEVPSTRARRRAATAASCRSRDAPAASAAPGGFRVEGVGSRVKGVDMKKTKEFWENDLEFWDSGCEFRVSGLGCRVEGLKIQGLGFGLLGCRVKAAPRRCGPRPRTSRTRARAC